jgi:mRNA-degrading endonuclease RelE of RelBE toxin-antitoxin system
MRKFQWTRSFKKGYKKLPEGIKEQAKKQLRLLAQNPHHPSLNLKKMNDPRDIWEGRITYSYRFTFQMKGNVYLLRNIGSHDILKKP